jgi:hypothetical protein
MWPFISRTRRPTRPFGDWPGSNARRLPKPFAKRSSNEQERVHSEIPLIEGLKPIQDQLKSLSKPGGLPAGKAFFDELSGDF